MDSIFMEDVFDAIEGTGVFPILAGFIGLCLGSFAGLVSWRLPRGEQVVEGRSRCPKCLATLHWDNLVPLLSWLFQRGRCHNCGDSIGIRYPLIEFTMVVLTLLVYVRWGFTLTGALLMLLACALVILAVTDLEAGIIPDKVSLALAAIGLVFQIVVGNVWLGLATAVFTGVLALLLRIIFLHLLKRESLGLGDVKLFAVAGLWLGPAGLPVFLIMSGLIGLITGLARRVLGGGREFPFGPAMALGLFCTVLYPELIVFIA